MPLASLRVCWSVQEQQPAKPVEKSSPGRISTAQMTAFWFFTRHARSRFLEFSLRSKAAPAPFFDHLFIGIIRLYARALERTRIL